MFGLAVGGGQPLGDLVDAVGRGQLAEEHGELPPAGEAAGTALGAMPANGGVELETGKQLEQLAENATYSSGLLSQSKWSCNGHISTYPRCSPLRPCLGPRRRRFSKPILDGSDLEPGIQISANH